MSENPSLLSTIDSLKLCTGEQRDELRARQVIFGGSTELNLLELGFISEAELLNAISHRFGAPTSSPGRLALDPESCKRLSAAGAMALGGIAGNESLLVYVTELPTEAQERAIRKLFDVDVELCMTSEFRFGEGHSVITGEPLSQRLSQLQAKLGFTSPSNAEDGLEPMSVKWTALSKVSPSSIIETGPPPQDYEELAAAATIEGVKAPRSLTASPRPTYAISEAAEDLKGARSKDRVIDVLLHFASQYFDYTAIFAVLASEARGLRASGKGTSSEGVRLLRIPLDLPSAFRDARESAKHQIRRLRAAGLEGGIARDLARPTGKDLLLLPICVRNRPILLLWGDQGAENVATEKLGNLFAFSSLVSETLEQVLLEHKRASLAALPQKIAPSLNSASSIAPAPKIHQVASAEKRALTQPRKSRKPGSSLPPSGFPSVLPKTLPGFPESKNTAELAKKHERRTSNTSSSSEATSLLQSRRIVALAGAGSVDAVSLESDSKSSEAPTASEGGSHAGSDNTKGGTLISRRGPQPGPGSSEPEELHGAGAQEGIPYGSSSGSNSCTLLVQRLLSGDEGAIERLVDHGDTAVGALVAIFPGPTTEPSSARAPASSCGPILKALAKLGRKATPFLTVRTADEDPNVRRWATLLLGELPGKDSAISIAERLLDDAPEVRRAALASARRSRGEALTRRSLRAQIESLCRDRRLATESRCLAVEAIADIREQEAIPTLLQLLDEEERTVARAAHWALSVLTRQDFGKNSSAWQQFWQEHRNQDRELWLIESLTHASRDIRRAAGEELKALVGEDFGYNEDLPESKRNEAQERFQSWWNNQSRSAS